MRTPDKMTTSASTPTGRLRRTTFPTGREMKNLDDPAIPVLLLKPGDLIIRPSRAFDFDVTTHASGEALAVGEEGGAAANLIAVPIVKSGRNDYPNRITLGRAPTNDIVLGIPMISKLHAYFQKDPSTGEFSLWDAGSSFGTRVDGKDLVPGEPRPLENDARIIFAGRIQALFIETRIQTRKPDGVPPRSKSPPDLPCQVDPERTATVPLPTT